jgi:hypothetical protein
MEVSMYGTVSRVKIKPDALGELERLAQSTPEMRGPGVSMVFQMDADPSEIMLVAAAESKEVYRDISGSPEMHQAYLERRKWFESEPEWNDGQVIDFWHRPAAKAANLYGSIAEMHLKPGAVDALKNRAERGAPREGGVALCVLQMDGDPDRVFVAAVSESESAYRAYSESEESHERYLEMAEWFQSEPKWHDGHLLEFRVSGNSPR